MDRSDDDSQLTHPQNMHNKLKRSHDTTPPLTPRTSTDLLKPEKRQRFENGQEGQDSAIANTVTSGSHVHHRLDVSATGQEELGEWAHRIFTSLILTDIGTDISTARESQPETQVDHASHAPSPHAADPADAKQTNAFFQNAHSFNISGNSSFQNQNIGSVTNFYGGGTDGLQNLNGFVSFDAQFDSSAQDPDCQCHPGTRENVLKRLRDWIDKPNSTEHIFWLHGPAGAGKSAIAQTTAHSYARPKVAGTFFFFRSDVNRNDGNRLFTTLAYQLAYSMPEIRECIAHYLSERPDIPKADVKTQFNQLLARPFQVLSDDSTQQLAPVVHVIIDIVKKYQELAPVIIIDGVDECTDEKLQRRFLKIIGEAVADDQFPLRFLIVSRPEVHIEQTIRRFQTPILQIDLAELDDANRDIEKYLVDEFSRIASEQDLDPTWPGLNIIRDIVYKSSGNFIYASVVIRFVGDTYCFAKTQLEIVLNMKPLKSMSPFAILDQLFLEILRRVPDQDFLKRYLTLLTARISVSNDYGDLYKDDAVLMHVSKEELHANLRRMRSLLRFGAAIDVHHQSFLDFLHDSSRSGQYYTGEQGGIRRYLEVFVDSLVRYISTVIEQPDCHSNPHFNPRFRDIVDTFPPEIELPAYEWQEVTRPLLDLQNKLLQLPNFTSTWHLLPCGECTAFHILRELLHLGLYLEMFIGQPSDTSIRSVVNAQKLRGVVSSTTTETEKKTNGDGLDSILLSLLAHLPEIMNNWSPNDEVIILISAILHFDPAEVAGGVRLVSDAQKLVDLFVYMIRTNNALNRIHPDAIRKACLLALEIFARAPILPLSFLWNGHDTRCRYTWSSPTIPTQILSETVFASRILDRYYIVPLLGECGTGFYSIFLRTDVQNNYSSLTRWRRRIIPISVTVIQIMLEVAKAIQYFHSLGVILDRKFGSNNVLLDPDLRPKICCWCSTSRSLLDQHWKGRFSPEDNIFSFGCIFYELFSGVDTEPLVSSEERRDILAERLSVPEMSYYAWQLIQRCCAEDPGSRPTIDEVVEEIESWK